MENQLQRVRSQASMGAYEDEFETQLDGANGNGDGNAANGR